MNCDYCKQEVKILVFHDNGLVSCHKCAPEVRKMKPPVRQEQGSYKKTSRGYLVAR